MSAKANQTRKEFEEFLVSKNQADIPRWLKVVDFGLKTLLQSVGELKESQEVYDVTDLERVDSWRDKMRSEQAWQNIDEQNGGLLRQALNRYRQFIESLDWDNHHPSGLKSAKPIANDDDTEEPEPGVKISRQKSTILITGEVTEGEASEVTVTKYERSRLARKLCIEAYGSTYRCEVCGFRLSDKYGSRDGREAYIEVHHIAQHAVRSKESGNHAVNYRTELIPLCPNCHRMIHHLKDHTISPDELREIIQAHERKG